MNFFDGKSVLITGGTGSFGRMFVHKLLTESKASRIIIYSRDEMKQFDMAQDEVIQGRKEIRFFIGDVRDRNRLETAMRNVDYVIHAAALKQVPAAEYNPFECINTNIMGAENIVQAAMRTGVKKVVALSTDKAASPINLYGATKLASDKIFVAANNMAGENGSRFSVVRYGNVIGSRGSVIPFFEKLIKNKSDHLPITDPRMTRFWITLEDGIDFVTESFKLMVGGEVFVPKIPSMRITDLAKTMAPDLPHKIVGIRPGEKLHETMITVDDARNTNETETGYVIKPSFTFWHDKGDQAWAGTPVAEDFSYSSDNNTQWMSSEEISRLIKAL